MGEPHASWYRHTEQELVEAPLQFCGETRGDRQSRRLVERPSWTTLGLLQHLKIIFEQPHFLSHGGNFPS